MIYLAPFLPKSLCKHPLASPPDSFRTQPHVTARETEAQKGFPQGQTARWARIPGICDAHPYVQSINHAAPPLGGPTAVLGAWTSRCMPRAANGNRSTLQASALPRQDPLDQSVWPCQAADGPNAVGACPLEHDRRRPGHCLVPLDAHLLAATFLPKPLALYTSLRLLDWYCASASGLGSLPLFNLSALLLPQAPCSEPSPDPLAPKKPALVVGQSGSVCCPLVSSPSSIRLACPRVC